MELLQGHVHVFANSVMVLSAAHWRLRNESNITLAEALAIVQGATERLVTECERSELTVTAVQGKRVLRILTMPQLRDNTSVSALAHNVGEVVTRLLDELEARTFLELPLNRKVFYEFPRTGWQDVIERFPDTVTDIEEMNRCFALSRYAASVFHSAQVIETGLIDLGHFIRVNDPRSGWTAVTKALKNIVNKPHAERSDFERTHYNFLEQMHGTAEALKNAWRNKVSHAPGRLILLSSDFTPDIAEEIIMATRAFMRRLAVDLPQ